MNNIIESAKVIVNNYITYIINNTAPATPPTSNTVAIPDTPEREPVVRTFLPNDLSANVKMDIEEAVSERGEDDVFTDQVEDVDDNATFPMEVNPGDDDEIAPYVTLFRGMRIATEEDAAEEEDLMDWSEEDPRLKNVTLFRGNRVATKEEHMDWSEDRLKTIALFCGNRTTSGEEHMEMEIADEYISYPYSDSDEEEDEEEVKYIDISDSIDDYTISAMRYGPTESGTIRGCMICRYFVASSQCIYSEIRCAKCDCLMDYVL